MDVANRTTVIEGESALDENLDDPRVSGNVGVSSSHSGRPIIAGLPQRKK